ncbi:MAG: hypothetical protein JOY77_12580 [Alphaproteobacteria bacterium]|nr:hypothetical protein [Alphaproteobacteria bacterium]
MHFATMAEWRSSFEVLAAGALIAGLAFAAPSQAATFQTITAFCSDFPTCSIGANPAGGLLLDSAGHLYGTAPSGGTGFGTVYELSLSGGKWTPSLLYAFCAQSGCNDGVSPESALIIDTAGNLYGVTPRGGANGGGVAFELSPTGGTWQLKVLYAFCAQGGSACTDGSTPSGVSTQSNVGLTYFGAATGQPYDGVSPLFGTTVSGGLNNAGTVFQLTNSGGTWSEKVLYSFCAKAACADGSMPGNLIVSASNSIYGTTGAVPGTVFQLKANSKLTKWKLSTLYTFCSASNCADGETPDSLSIDGTGKLLGTAASGGTGSNCNMPGGCGAAFSLVPKKKGSLEKVLYNFCSQAGCADGSLPAPGIALDTAGNLYNATNLGGNDNCFGGSTCGAVIEVAGTTEQVLHAFCPQERCTEGTSPQSGPIRDAAGNLFGTTAFGGKFGGGSVYEITP